MAVKGKRAVEVEDLFRLRVIADADISPDGERIVFALSRFDLKKNGNFAGLYMVPARGGRIRRLTRGDRVDSHPRFAPDGDSRVRAR